MPREAPPPVNTAPLPLAPRVSACLCVDFGCKGQREYPDDDSVGFCAACWESLPEAGRALLTDLSRAADLAEKSAEFARAVSDGALDATVGGLRVERFGQKAPARAPLPCYPCPHASACCSWGASLEPDEAEAIQREHAGWRVTRTGNPEDPFRTRVHNGACVFKMEGPGGGCSIHDKPYYPAVCRGFPTSDGLGGPYTADVTICPELRPAPPTDAPLVQVAEPRDHWKQLPPPQPVPPKPKAKRRGTRVEMGVAPCKNCGDYYCLKHD